MMHTISLTYCRWFQKSYGNSYFALSIYLEDYEKQNFNYFLTENLEYGYSTQPFYSAIKHLRELGYDVSDSRYIKQNDEYIRVITINGVDYKIIDTDMGYLPRQKDCKNWIATCKRVFPEYIAI